MQHCIIEFYKKIAYFQSLQTSTILLYRDKEYCQNLLRICTNCHLNVLLLFRAVGSNVIKCQKQYLWHLQQCKMNLTKNANVVCVYLQIYLLCFDIHIFMALKAMVNNMIQDHLQLQSNDMQRRLDIVNIMTLSMHQMVHCSCCSHDQIT